MNTMQVISAFLADNGWFMLALAFTIGYGVILGIMIKKITRDRSLPEADRPGPRPLFYLGQAYLAFVWPVPLFLVLEGLNLLTPLP